MRCAVLFWLSWSLAAAPELTLRLAVEQALARYPSVPVSTAAVRAAAANIALARTAYLPRVDLVAQTNRATHNNVFGLLLPQAVIAPISGPVLDQSTNNVWGTAVGALVSWEPYDFGRRAAETDIAVAGQRVAEAGVARTRLEVATLTADAYLTLLAAEQTVIAAQASVRRAATLEEIVGSLVRAELRPGLDATRIRAERAAAQTQLIQAEQSVEMARAALAALVGTPAAELQTTPITGTSSADPQTSVTNPLLAEQQAIQGEAAARFRALQKQYFPRFLLQGTSYSRGSGVEPTGRTGGFASGLAPSVPNWGVGLTVTFNPLDLPALRARERIAAANVAREAARATLAQVEINARIARAQTQVNGSRRIADNTPVQVEAARAAETQARARYQAGLSTVLEVSDAQRLLAQAETDDALARLGIWRALLTLAAAQGDLTSFLQAVQ